MNRIRTYSIACLLAIVFTQISRADWTSFRNGGSSQIEQPLPTKWSDESGIAWQYETEGYGQSSPVVIDDAIFLTSVVGSMSEVCIVECRDLATGELRWTYRHDSTYGHPSNYMNARAAPTPVVDKRGAYAFFETGDLIAVDLEGNLLWKSDLTEKTGKYDNSHGVGASLAQNDSRIFLNLEHGGPSFLIAIDKQSGKPAWTVDRPSTKSWSSPIIADIDNEQQVIVSSGGSVSGYDASNGRLLWSLDGIDGNSVPSPTLSGSLLIVGARLPEFANESDLRSNCCLDLSNIVNGQPQVIWRAEKAICEYASPVVVDDSVYFLNKANVLHCLDIQTGDIAYRKRLNGAFWATPIVAAGRLYFFSKDGQCHIVSAGKSFELLSTNRLWDPENPPAPLAYEESQGQGDASARHTSSSENQGHGEGGADDHAAIDRHSGTSEDPGASLATRIKAGDKNGDGVLEGEEIPEIFRNMLARIDSDGNGKLDQQEIEAMASSFAERRKHTAANARDPIVYGAAASAGQIIVRTGTRLYAIGN